MKIGEKQKAYLKGYAMAIQDLMYNLTGENSMAKSYDPIQIDETYIHSYAFNLKDGGRHHPLTDYNNLEEITNLMLKEGCEWIKEYKNE
jgi:hypothetical protein